MGGISCKALLRGLDLTLLLEQRASRHKGIDTSLYLGTELSFHLDIKPSLYLGIDRQYSRE